MAKKTYMTFNFSKLSWSQNTRFQNTLIRNRRLFPIFETQFNIQTLRKTRLLGLRVEISSLHFCSQRKLFCNKNDREGCGSTLLPLMYSTKAVQVDNQTKAESSAEVKWE